MADGKDRAVRAKAPLSAFELFNKSSRLVQNNFATFAVLYIIPLLSTLGFLRSGGNFNNQRRFSGLESLAGLPGYALGALIGTGLLLFILVVMVSLIVRAMTYALQLESAKGKKPHIEQLWPYAKKYWLRLFGLSIVTAIFILGGLILLIIPGFIALRRYFLAPYVMIDKNLSIGEAMKSSAILSKPYSRSIWSVIGVTALISLPSIIPIFGWAISFVLAFLYSVAPALRYEELKKLT